MSNHTPGPWKVFVSHLNTFTVVTDDTRGRIICDFDRHNRVNNEDNATLIAAAPELLEAVRFALSVLLANYPVEASEFLAIKKLDAAIASAEGVMAKPPQERTMES